MCKIVEGASCTVRNDTDTLPRDCVVTFVRLEHFCGGTNIIVHPHGRRAFERIALMPGKTVEDYLMETFP